MKRMSTMLALCLALALLATPQFAGAQAQPAAKKPQPTAAEKMAALKEPKAEEVAKITEAMPKQAVAKPAKARKILVFSNCKGFVHDAIPYGVKALQLMGEQTGAFSVVASNDIAMFAPEKLNEFDAVVMNNTTGTKYFRPEGMDAQAADELEKKYQQSLLDFVKGGKGLIGIHAATDCSYGWADYGEMIGGYFAGHPWHMVVPIKINDPEHIINQPFGGKGFSVNDEIYTFKTPPYSLEKLHELVSLDNATLPPPNTGSKVTRPDGDYAMGWVKPCGQGRVFYTAFGHEHAIFWNAPILDHWLRGIQYALGDLKADDSPTKK